MRSRVGVGVEAIASVAARPKTRVEARVEVSVEARLEARVKNI